MNLGKIFKNALPTLKAIGSAYVGGTTAQAIAQAVSSANARKEQARAKMQAAQSSGNDAAYKAAVAEFNQASIQAAGSQTVANGLANGTIPVGSSPSQAQLLVIRAMLAREGIDPDSPEGQRAAQTVHANVQSNTVKHIAIGAGVAAFLGGLYLATRK